ncbi:SsgA family sporulation/cell division regulator [Marmoricola sp. RAF53]|uniref:SsgA family sporulation/cell division regulator n=1 Tax=Marmoricola sp. RAF53 TaxID=3233059 RepID=UPI003F981E63
MTNRNALSGQIRRPIPMIPVQDDQVLTAIDVVAGYDPADPYAVSFAFGEPVSAAVWTFSRDLLIDGVTAPTGEGDVQVWPCLDVDGRATVVVELRSPTGELALQVLTKDVHDFVRRTLDAVPLGTESDHLDLDAADAWLASLGDAG